MYSSFNQVRKTVYFGSRTKKGCSEVAMRAAAIWLLAPTAQCFAPAATAGDPAVVQEPWLWMGWNTFMLAQPKTGQNECLSKSHQSSPFSASCRFSEFIVTSRQMPKKYSLDTHRPKDAFKVRGLKGTGTSFMQSLANLAA